jgi:hypothetical protein
MSGILGAPGMPEPLHGNQVWRVVRLATTNDSNGNPRRLLVGRTDDGAELIVDEGYNGDGPRFIRSVFGTNGLYDGTTYNVSPGEYRQMVKRAVHL